MSKETKTKLPLFFQKIIDFINNYLIYRRFLNNNKKLFIQKNFKTKNKILVELFDFPASYIAFSYLANALKKKHKANIFSFRANYYSKIALVKQIIKNHFVHSAMSFSRSIGSIGLIHPDLKESQEVKKIFNQLIKSINKKKDILDIKIYSIPVGDLIYDEFLARYNVGTVNIDDRRFSFFLKHSIKLFIFWYNKIQKKEVKALITSHTVYFIGMPARIAIYKNIPCYQLSWSSCSYLTRDYQTPFEVSKYIPKIYNKIPKPISKKLKKNAKDNIISDFLGIKKDKIPSIEIKIKRAQQLVRSKKELSTKKKLNILIAAHCFTDSVHVYGTQGLFVDHMAWIEFLGNISKKTDYNWFIKFHPSHYDNNYIKMIELIKKYPKFRIVPKNYKNINLLKKINYALTVHGTMGREYPYFNIPVLNASDNGPHRAYKFSNNFSYLKDYENAILNIKKINIKKDEINKISEFFTARFLIQYFYFGLDAHNILWPYGGLKKYYQRSHLIKYWNNHIDNKIHNKHCSDIQKFIDSKQNLLMGDNSNPKEVSKYMEL